MIGTGWRGEESHYHNIISVPLSGRASTRIITIMITMMMIIIMSPVDAVPFSFARVPRWRVAYRLYACFSACRDVVSSIGSNVTFQSGQMAIDSRVRWRLAAVLVWRRGLVTITVDYYYPTVKRSRVRNASEQWRHGRALLDRLNKIDPLHLCAMRKTIGH